MTKKKELVIVGFNIEIDIAEFKEVISKDEGVRKELLKKSKICDQ